MEAVRYTVQDLDLIRRATKVLAGQELLNLNELDRRVFIEEMTRTFIGANISADEVAAKADQTALDWTNQCWSGSYWNVCSGWLELRKIPHLKPGWSDSCAS